MKATLIIEPEYADVLKKEIQENAYLYTEVDYTKYNVFSYEAFTPDELETIEDELFSTIGGLGISDTKYAVTYEF